jgi:O-antigen/teichoic acid export membrane protein
MGAFGYLLGYMISALIMIIPNFVIAFRQISLVFNLSVVKDALIYTLPLVPHSLSAWVLELSDRSILQKYVPLGEIGIYSLGYQFGSLLALLASAINSAWVPFLFRVYDQDPENASKRVSQLITYYVMFLSFILLGLMLFVQNIVEVMASPAYHEAYHVTYWVLVGQFFMALYYIPVNFLFLKKKTQWVPVVTITSGLIDIILNFILIPKYGYIGAAWAGLISKLAMLLIVYFIASKFVNLFYEYRRITLSVVWAAFLIFIGNQFSYFPLWVNLVIKSLVIIAYPAGLVMLGFLNNDEKVVLHRLFSSR